MTGLASEECATSPGAGELVTLEAGQQIVFGGNRVTTVPAELAAAFVAGDRLLVVQETGDLLHVPAAEHAAATRAVDGAVAAFAGLATCSDEQVTAFFDGFAGAPRRRPRAGARSARRTTPTSPPRRPPAARRPRLVLSDRMRDDMVAGLRSWRDAPAARDTELARIDHPGWSVAARRAPLGVVGFVFEGRPNVFADASGVLRTGNTVVMRIGSDALRTAEAIVAEALAPALAAAGLPDGAVSLVRSPARPRDGPCSTTGAWPSPSPAARVPPSPNSVPWPARPARRSACTARVAPGSWPARQPTADRFAAAVRHSLDRKVCNTLNVCCIPAARQDLVAVFLDVARRSRGCPGHDRSPARHARLAPRRTRRCGSRRSFPSSAPTACTTSRSPPRSTRASSAASGSGSGRRRSSLVVTADVDEAVDLCNRHSPRFVASLISADAAEHARFYDRVDAPFVGDGFTRWVDGQYALDTPELGLSNWQGGRLLGRGGVLSGDSVHTVRYRATVTDPDIHR